MPLRRSALIITIVSVFAGLFAARVVGATPAGGLEAVWKDYTVARKRFQYDLAKLLGHEWPDLDGIAALQRDLQFALIELNDLRFRYLLEHDPDRLVIDQGLDAFVSFEWTEEDSEALRGTSESCARLEQWVEKFTAELHAHPDLSRADHSVSRLHSREVYRHMIVRYQKRLSDIESALLRVARASAKHR